VALIHRLDNLHGVLGNSQQAIPVLSHSTMLPAGGSDDQTAKEIIFEAQSQLDKQQKEEHGGVVRGSDAAKVQVTSDPTLPPPPPLPPGPTAVLLLMWCSCIIGPCQHIGSLNGMAVRLVLTGGC